MGKKKQSQEAGKTALKISNGVSGKSPADQTMSPQASKKSRKAKSLSQNVSSNSISPKYEGMSESRCDASSKLDQFSQQNGTHMITEDVRTVLSPAADGLP